MQNKSRLELDDYEAVSETEINLVYKFCSCHFLYLHVVFFFNSCYFSFVISSVQRKLCPIAWD